MSEGDSGSAAGVEAAAKPSQLSRELTEFLVELSVAMHKHAIYPPGHPLLSQSVDAVHKSLLVLLQDRPALSIGVARRQLIIEGVATGAVHPLLAELAGKLHRHHIGAVKFVRGLSRDELSSALGTVGVEPQKDEQPLGLQPDLLESRWANVKLFPLLYDRLELLDEAEKPGVGGRPANAQDGRAAELWVGLARAAIAAEQGPDRDTPMEPENVANAINEHDREPAYDQAIVGFLLQIAHEVRHDGTEPVTVNAGLKRRISKLVGSLNPDTLQRLLEMGGDGMQRRKFVLDAAQGMSVEAVVELVRAAATAEGQTISHSLVRMLTKLATHASGDVTLRSQAADGEFRAHVERLVGSWSLDDPNPQEYSVALEQMSRSGADASGPAPDSRFPCEPSRVIAMALELGVQGESVTRAVRTSLESDALAELLDLLDAAPHDRTETVDAIWSLIAAADPLRALLASSRLDHTLIRRVVTRTGASAAPALLGALDASAEGAGRDRLIGYLVSLGQEVAPEIASRLAAAAPSLARELLACLTRLAPPILPAGARSFLTHADPSLRREAAKLLLAYDDTRESAMLVAVRDDDTRVMYAGLLAAQERCSSLTATTIRQRMDRGEITDSAALVAAVRAIGSTTDDLTLDWMLRRTVVTGGLLRRTRLAPTTPELLAALSVLAARWSSDARAMKVLERARASTSPTVRAAVAVGGRVTMEREKPA